MRPASSFPGDSRATHLPRSTVYPLVGALLAVGAPAGLIVLRRLLAWDPTIDGVLTDVSADAPTYAYLTTSTTVVFLFLGVWLGRIVDRLRAFATTDPLTGLANRRYFLERVRTELARARRYGSPLSLLLVDLDRLKRINDELGHAAGDAALRRIATVLSATCRATDLIARWGGDEFMILTPGITATEALALGTRFRELLRGSDDPSVPIRTTVSIGITDVNRLHEITPEALYAAADAALYRAKQSGRDRAIVYEGEHVAA